jgi:hypothetical protein
MSSGSGFGDEHIEGGDSYSNEEPLFIVETMPTSGEAILMFSGTG